MIGSRKGPNNRTRSAVDITSFHLHCPSDLSCSSRRQDLPFSKNNEAELAFEEEVEGRRRTMSSKSAIEHEATASHDALRFGLASVKSDIVGSHPLESRLPAMEKEYEEKKRMGRDLIYGSALNLRRDLDAQILSRFQRPPGALPSSMLGLEALTGALDTFDVEDYLNVPQDSENFQPPDMHHGMEVRLGMSKGPICRSVI